MVTSQKKGQTLVEYTLLITIVLGALLAMGTYIKRGLQGRWKAAVDDMGDQYDPLMANTKVRYTLDSQTTTTLTGIQLGGGQVRTERSDFSTSIDRKVGQDGITGY